MTSTMTTSMTTTMTNKDVIFNPQAIVASNSKNVYYDAKVLFIPQAIVGSNLNTLLHPILNVLIMIMVTS